VTDTTAGDATLFADGRQPVLVDVDLGDEDRGSGEFDRPVGVPVDAADAARNVDAPRIRTAAGIASGRSRSTDRLALTR